MSAISSEDIWRALAINVEITMMSSKVIDSLYMGAFYINQYFIPTDELEWDKIIKITNDDIDLKVEFYKYCIKNPNKVYQGTKKYNFPIDKVE